MKCILLFGLLILCVQAVSATTVLLKQNHTYIVVGSFDTTREPIGTAQSYANDLSVHNITFSSPRPVEGENISVIVALNNTFNTTISFQVNLTFRYWNGSAHVVTATNRQTINASNSTPKALFFWKAAHGNNSFFVQVDAGNNVSESNESNNNASTVLHVSSWQIFYGDITRIYTMGMYADPFLDLGDALAKGNLFASDSDDALSILTLQGVTMASELTKADRALNLTGSNDTLTKLFDANNDGVVDVLENITIAGEPVLTAFINTTNSSYFRTGIVFDSSMGEPYNGTQPLVFVTSFGSLHVGLYGTYQYEIRVPSTLGMQNMTTPGVVISTELQ